MAYLIYPVASLLTDLVIFIVQIKEKLVSAISSLPPPSNPEDALKQSGTLAAVTSGSSSSISDDAKVQYFVEIINCSALSLKGAQSRYIALCLRRTFIYHLLTEALMY